MKKVLSTITLFGGLLLLVGCSQEELIPDVRPSDVPSAVGRPIMFRAGMGTRVNSANDYTDEENFKEFFVTCYKNSHQSQDGNEPAPYFKEERFNEVNDNLFVSENPDLVWPNNSASIEFFAYAPSLASMQAAAFTQLDDNASSHKDDETSYRNKISFSNVSEKFNNNGNYDPVTGSDDFNGGLIDGQAITPGFKLGRFYVATDISKQVDFVTAHVYQEDINQEHGAVSLAFKHQLSCVELKAFSANPDYNIEIAGVRLGRPYTGNAMFNFCTETGAPSAEDGGKWEISSDPQRLPVEYIFGKDDVIVKMGKYNGNTINNTKEGAISIMGLGGNAMVLPTKNGAWSGRNNKWISSNNPNNTEGAGRKAWTAGAATTDAEGDMYFSVLLRVTLKDKPSKQLYPYAQSRGMNVVYFSSNKTDDKIISRVEKDAIPANDNEEILSFGWAAVPVGVDWKPGYKYTYILDFTEGVGVQDPEDRNPGIPILSTSGIQIQMSLASWTDATQEEIHFKNE